MIVRCADCNRRSATQAPARSSAILHDLRPLTNHAGQGCSTPRRPFRARQARIDGRRHCRRRHRRVDAGARAPRLRPRRPHPGVRGGARDPPARRRHQSRAACGQGAERAGAAGGAGGGRLPAAGLRVLHPPRPAGLSRAVGHGGRPPVAALLDPPRRPAPGAARRGARAARRRQLHHRPSLRRRRAERGARHRALRRPRRRRARRASRATC